MQCWVATIVQNPLAFNLTYEYIFVASKNAKNLANKYPILKVQVGFGGMAAECNWENMVSNDE